MKSFKVIAKNIHPSSKLILKYGTIFAMLLLIFAFLSKTYGIMMCKTSVFLFAESIISALLFDVIDKRRN